MENKELAQLKVEKTSNFNNYQKFCDTKNGYIDVRMLSGFLNVKSPRSTFYQEKIDILNNLFEGTDVKFDSLKNINLTDLKFDIQNKVVFPENNKVDNINDFKAFNKPGDLLVLEKFKKPVRDMQERALKSIKSFQVQLEKMSTSKVIELKDDPNLQGYSQDLTVIELQKRIYAVQTDKQILDVVSEQGLSKSSTLPKYDHTLIQNEISKRIDSGQMSQTNVEVAENKFEKARLTSESVLTNVRNSPKNESSISQGFARVALAANDKSFMKFIKENIPSDHLIEFIKSKTPLVRNEMNDNAILLIVDTINNSKELVDAFKKATNMEPIIDKKESIKLTK